jgi:hypothetical protein
MKWGLWLIISKVSQIIPILSWIRSIFHIDKCRLFNVHSNIGLPFIIKVSLKSSSYRFTYWNFESTAIFFHSGYMPCTFIHLDLITLNVTNGTNSEVALCIAFSTLSVMQSYLCDINPLVFLTNFRNYVNMHAQSNNLLFLINWQFIYYVDDKWCLRSHLNNPPEGL